MKKLLLTSLLFLTSLCFGQGQGQFGNGSSSSGASGTVSPNNGSAGAAAIFAAASGSTTVSASACLFDNGTTLSYICSGGLSLSGTGAGFLSLIQGAAHTAPTNGFGLQAPTLISTGYVWTVPAVDCNGSLTITSDVMTCTASPTGTNGNVVSFGASNALVDTGFLATNVVRKDAANTGGAAMTLDMSASTSSSALRAPNIAGGTSSALGAVTYDTTVKNMHGTLNGADALIAQEATAIAANRLAKSASSTLAGLVNSSITDNATTVSSAENYSFGTAGGIPNIDLTIGFDASAMSPQTTATCTNVTGMTWIIAASKNYIGHCQLPITFAASATIAFCLGGPGTPTLYNLNAIGSIGLTAAYDDINIIGATTYGTKTAASGAVGVSSTIVSVDFFVENGSTASGTALTLQTAANGTNSFTIGAGDVCKVTQAN